MDQIGFVQAQGDHVMVELPLSMRAFGLLLLVCLLVAAALVAFLVTPMRTPSDSPSRPWHIKAVTTLGVIFAPIWALLLMLVLWSLLKLTDHMPGIADGTELRWHVLALVGLLTALGGLLGTPLALIRVHTTERQTKTAEQGHVTDQINKAVENLGATRLLKRRSKDGDVEELALPNIEVRTGGLLALERISKSNPEEHVLIMNILCAYIRENARAQVAEVPMNDKGEPESENAIPLRDDLGTAFDILDRRSERLEESARLRDIEKAEDFRLNFKNADMRGLYLTARKLGGAVFYGAQLQGANLRVVQLKGANLLGAQLQGAYLLGAQLQGANLSTAQLQGANLHGAQLQGANLHGAQLQGAFLFGAHLQGASVDSAGFDDQTDLSYTNFHGAAVRSVNFKNVGISTDQLQQMFGDASVKLPGGKGPDDPNWPKEWEKEELGWDYDPDKSEFHQAWHAWQDKIGFDRQTNALKQQNT